MKLVPFACCGAALMLATFALPASASSQSISAPSAEAAAAEFVSAFNALDRTRFDPLFADDVTVFFPSAPFDIQRVEGKPAVLAWFGKFFDAMRERTGNLNIEPADLKVHDYDTIAVVTFHLKAGDNLGRRTLILHREGNGWKIVHLHASAEPPKKSLN
ncbi:DUF4440 domain-containing protein [Altererythrobacter aurantiacus]|uniref:DUF4440 domain-containing protein n=1 Tax=Parapontixanthobacter aurantiacus TaxID=1463599 RepID=A0A844ZGY5_9SPHN|nr:nuclear transport factor 2 family protein [Parapontixanthobacter aurantiacus]MXO86512.1 DUF4440 domain-containing protein [Parapontixanthobacter aurantiacus]